jgi:peptidoglycan hydrolase CwlO-like protein
MDDNKVAVLLENLSSQFKVFGEGLEIVQRQVSELNQKVDGLIEDMDMVKPALVKINNRLDTIEGEIIKLNPDSRAAFVKQAK